MDLGTHLLFMVQINVMGASTAGTSIDCTIWSDSSSRYVYSSCELNYSYIRNGARTHVASYRFYIYKYKATHICTIYIYVYL